MEQEILWKLAGTGDPGTDAGNTTDVEEAWSVDAGDIDDDGTRNGAAAW